MKPIRSTTNLANPIPLDDQGRVNSERQLQLLMYDFWRKQEIRLLHDMKPQLGPFRVGVHQGKLVEVSLSELVQFAAAAPIVGGIYDTGNGTYRIISITLNGWVQVEWLDGPAFGRNPPAQLYFATQIAEGNHKLISSAPPVQLKIDYDWQTEDTLLKSTLEAEIKRITKDGVDEAALHVKDSIQVGGPNWTVINQKAAEWARTYTGSLAKGINDTTRAKIGTELAAWITAGESFPALVQRMRRIIPQRGSTATNAFRIDRAELIASTEATKAYAEGNLLAWRSVPGVTGKEWRAANDEKVCPVCGYLGGQQLVEKQVKPTEIEDLKPVSVALNADFVLPFGGGTIHAPPAHPRCLLPDTEVVSFGPLTAVTQAFYQGRCVEVVLGDGRKLSVTENHPILTPAGFIAAKRLRQGDDVICAFSPEQIAQSIDPNDNYRPASIEKVFYAQLEASGMSSVSVPVAAEQFHGDGRCMDGDVQIVRANGQLLDSRQSGILEHTEKGQFDNGGVADLALSGPSFEFQFGDTLFSATSGDMGITKHIVPLVGVGILPSNQHRISDIARADASFDQTLAEGLAIHTDFSRKFLLRFAHLVTVEQITQIRNFDFTGHVYDLQSDAYELYSGNGVIVKNCRCWIVPVMGTVQVAVEPPVVIKPSVPVPASAPVVAPMVTPSGMTDAEVLALADVARQVIVQAYTDEVERIGKLNSEARVAEDAFMAARIAVEEARREFIGNGPADSTVISRFEKQNQAIVDEAEAKRKALVVARNTLAVALKEQGKKALELLSVPDPIQPHGVKFDVHSARNPAKEREGLAANFVAWTKIVSAKIAPTENAPEIAVDSVTVRAGYAKDGNKITLAPGDSFYTLAHELGHWLEDNQALIKIKALEFLSRRRQKGEKPVRLIDVYPRSSYHKGEMAIKDKFDNAYIGKLYFANGTTAGMREVNATDDYVTPSIVEGTEVVSMGIEMYLQNPAGFAVLDPDYFNFIYALLRGFYHG